MTHTHEAYVPFNRNLTSAPNERGYVLWIYRKLTVGVVSHCPCVTNLTLSPPIPLRLYTLPYWSKPPFLIFRTERQSVRMSKIKNGGLDQYGAGSFEQQQFGTAGVKGVNGISTCGLMAKGWEIFTLPMLLQSGMA